MYSTGLVLLLAGVALGQAPFECLEDGFHPDPVQCDKYYDCYRGLAEAKLCPDGLVFDSSLSPRSEQCNYPFLVQCPENSVLQPAQATSIECPRLNGYFEHEDPSICDQYYECTGGIPVIRSCHEGLVFNEISGTCEWAHTGVRTGCGVRVEVLADGFTCPNATQIAINGHSLAHPRYPKPSDCRFFYTCLNGKHPKESGCPVGQVFNDVTLTCDDPANVPGCEHYYGTDVAADGQA